LALQEKLIVLVEQNAKELTPKLRKIFRAFEFMQIEWANRVQE
jgi:hypothetical protein